MDEKIMDEKFIGQKMLLSAISLNNSLSDILKLEVNILKKQLKSHDNPEDIQKTNRLIKNVIIALTLTEDNIKIGLDLYLGSDKKICDI